MEELLLRSFKDKPDDVIEVEYKDKIIETMSLVDLQADKRVGFRLLQALARTLFKNNFQSIRRNVATFVAMASNIKKVGLEPIMQAKALTEVKVKAKSKVDGNLPEMKSAAKNLDFQNKTYAQAFFPPKEEVKKNPVGRPPKFKPPPPGHPFYEE